MKQVIESSAEQEHLHSPGCCKRKREKIIVVSSAQQSDGESSQVLNGLDKMKRLFGTPKRAAGRQPIIESSAQQVDEAPVDEQKPKDMKVKDASIEDQIRALNKKKAAIKKSVAQRNVTSIKRLSNSHIGDAVIKCRRCTAEKRGCNRIDFMTVRHVRTLLYGPDMNSKKRRKVILQWLKEIDEFSMEERGVKNSKKSSRVLNYFLPDFSFQKDAENIVKIPCCRECFVAVVGVSNAFITKLWKEYRTLKDTDEIDNVCKGSRGLEATPERLQVHAWLEMFCTEQACRSPDLHKSELSGVTSLEQMHQLFKIDWEAGVLKGSSFRKYRGSGKRKNPGKKIPRRTQKVPVVRDEDGAYEASNKVKEDLMAKFPCPSYQFFCKVWKSDFNGEFKIPRRHRRFTQCNWCAELKANIKHASREDKLYWKNTLYGHYKWLTKQRDVYYKHRKKAEMQPSK